MATYTSGFAATAGADTKAQVQQAIDRCHTQAQEAGTTLDWTTLTIVTKSLATGWPQMPAVIAYGVLISTTP